jgi:hypothetical protein
MVVCVRLFCVVLSCVYVAALRWADPSSKEFYRLCIGLQSQSQTKDCKAIDEWMNTEAVPYPHGSLDWI